MMCGWDEKDIAAGTAGFPLDSCLSPALENCGRQEGADIPLGLEPEMDVDRHWCHADAHEDSQEEAQEDALFELVVEMDLDTNQTATQEAGEMLIGDFLAKLASLEIVDDMDLDPESDELTQGQSNGWLSVDPGHEQSTWEIEGRVTMLDADDMEYDA